MNPIVTHILAGLLGAAVGGGSVYVFAKKHMEKQVEAKWEAITEEQIQSVKDEYRIVRGEGIYADPENLVSSEDLEAAEPYRSKSDLKRLTEELVDAGYIPEGGGILRPSDSTAEFAQDDLEEPDPESQPLEGAYISPADDLPHIISIEEFAMPSEGYEHYETVTITYHEGDETLLDSQGGIEMDKNGIVGVENLKRFGHLSNDDDIVYIRNPRLGIHFEVVRVKVGYAESRGMSFNPDDAEEEPGYVKQRRKMRQEFNNSED